MIELDAIIRMGFNEKLISLLSPPEIRQKGAKQVILWPEETVDSIRNSKIFEEERLNKKNQLEKYIKDLKVENNQLGQVLETVIRGIKVKSEKNVEDTALQRMSARKMRVSHSILSCDTYSADKQTKDRWIVNYIRHRCTNYDKTCTKLGKYAEGETLNKAIQIYKIYMLDAIIKVYPAYAYECWNQQNICKVELEGGTECLGSLITQ